jgi:hypothetical protein
MRHKYLKRPQKAFFKEDFLPNRSINRIIFVPLHRIFNLNTYFIMARLIAETPVLSGSDARRFEEAISNVQPLSSERRAEMDAEYRSFTSKVIINI